MFTFVVGLVVVWGTLDEVLDEVDSLVVFELPWLVDVDAKVSCAVVLGWDFVVVPGVFVADVDVLLKHPPEQHSLQSLGLQLSR